MEIAIGILFLMFVLILWVVFVPVHIRIDTSNRLYELNQKGTIQLSFHPGEIPAFKMWMIGFRIPFSVKPKDKKKKTGKKKSKKFIERRFQTWLFLVKGIFRSFKVKKFICTIDSNDYILNAQLFPIISILNRETVYLSINFNQQNNLNLEIEGRVNKMLWTFILFLTKK